MENKMNYKQEEQFIIVYFYGDVDCTQVPLYRSELSVLFEQTQGDVIFDFSHISFIDSSGIGLILGRYNQLKFDHRRLILTGLSSVSYHVFDLTGMFSIMPYFQTVKEAKEKLSYEQNGTHI